MPFGNKRLDPHWQHLRRICAVPFLSLSEVYLKAVEPGEVPRRTGERNPDFFVDSPDIPVHLEALSIRRTNRVKRGVERITIAGKPRRVVFTAYGKGDRPRGQVKQVTVDGGIIYRQLILTRVMQSNISGPSSIGAVRAVKASERIKRRCW